MSIWEWCLIGIAVIVVYLVISVKAHDSEGGK